MLRRVMVVALLGLLSVTGIHTANGDADGQGWDDTRLIYNVDPKMAVFVANSFRLTQDFSNFTRVSGRVGMTWSPLPAVSIAPSYLYTVGDPTTSHARPENRLCLLLNYRIPVYTATLTLGNTTEFRMPEDGPNSWWLRPKVKVSHPIGPEKWDFSAFAADELFYNSRAEDWTRNRVFAGLEKKVNDSLVVQLYYCRQMQWAGANPSANAIGLDVRITFGPQHGPGPAEPDFE